MRMEETVVARRNRVFKGEVIPTPKIIYCPEDINIFSYGGKIYHINYFVKSCQADARDWVRDIVKQIPPETRFVQVFVSDFPIQTDEESARRCVEAFEKEHADDIVIAWVEKIHNPRGYAYVVYTYAIRCYEDQFYDSIILPTPEALGWHETTEGRR